ncbi:hypothetical protein PENSPDRAFT_752652 [Peniophora sp. CONT]|nr:hypothetical protein PENSPDRAFT_752652 [Peniophora sp. CONT]
MDGRLPLEILSLVLSEIDDLYTLGSAILTCRRLCGAFASGPRSLLAAVVQNQLGHVLMPAALRLALLQDSNCSQHAFPWDELTEEALSIFLATKPFLSDTPEYVLMIAKNIVTMSYFENLFSQIYKDRSSRSSKLTTDESRKFTLAMYRVWIFFEYWITRWEGLFDDCKWDSDGHDSDGDSVDMDVIDEWHEDKARLREEQADFLRQLSGVADNLNSEFRSAYAFLFRRVLPWVATSLSTTEHLYILTDIRVDFIHIGKALAHREERAKLAEILCVGRDGSDVSEAIRSGQIQVLGRDIQRVSTANQLPVSPVITYKCVECFHVSRVDAFLPCNAELLSGKWAPHDMAGCGFKSRLASNLALGLNDYFDSPSFSVTSFLGEIFGVARKAGDHVDEKAYYCLKCLVQIVSEHKEAWWLERMHAQAGASGGICFCEACRGKLQDCPLGYTCIKQGTNLEHARTLNHFCRSACLSAKDLRALDSEGGVQALFNDHAEAPASPNDAEASSSTTWQYSAALVRSKWYLTEPTNTTTSQD